MLCCVVLCCVVVWHGGGMWYGMVWFMVWNVTVLCYVLSCGVILCSSSLFMGGIVGALIAGGTTPFDSQEVSYLVISGHI